MVMNGFDTDADGENNFYTVNGRSFYYASYPIKVKRSQLVRIYLANLTEFDLVNSFHLHARLLPLPADGHGRQLGVHRHRDAVPGPAWRDRDPVREHRPLHVPRAPVGVRRARLDGLLRGRRLVEAGSATARGRMGWRLWAVVPVLLLAIAVGARRHERLVARRPRRDEPAARRRVRHPPRRVLARRDPDHCPEPAAGRPDDRERERRRRDRAVHGRRADDARTPPLEHDRRPVRLGGGGPDHGGRDELDRNPDREGDPGGDRDPGAVGRRLLRLRADRSARRRAPRRARASLAARAPAGEPRVALGVHGLHRRPAHVPRARGADGSLRAAGRSSRPLSAEAGSCCSASRSASSG